MHRSLRGWGKAQSIYSRSRRGTKEVDGRMLFASRRRGDRQALATSLSFPRYLTVSLSGRRERDGQNDTQHSVQAELAGVMA